MASFSYLENDRHEKVKTTINRDIQTPQRVPFNCISMHKPPASYASIPHHCHRANQTTPQILENRALVPNTVKTTCTRTNAQEKAANRCALPLNLGKKEPIIFILVCFFAHPYLTPEHLLLDVWSRERLASSRRIIFAQYHTLPDTSVEVPAPRNASRNRKSRSHLRLPFQDLSDGEGQPYYFVVEEVASILGSYRFLESVTWALP